MLYSAISKGITVLNARIQTTSVIFFIVCKRIMKFRRALLKCHLNHNILKNT